MYSGTPLSDSKKTNEQKSVFCTYQLPKTKRWGKKREKMAGEKKKKQNKTTTTTYRDASVHQHGCAQAAKIAGLHTWQRQATATPHISS